MSDSLRPHGLQQARLPVHHQLPELAQTHVHQVCDAIQPSHPLSSPSPLAFNLSQHQGLNCYLLTKVHHLSSMFLRPSSFSNWSLQMSQLFTSGGQSIEFSASTSVLPVNIQDWLDLLSVQRTLKGLLQNTTIQKHQFFSTQPALWSNYHIHT